MHLRGRESPRSSKILSLPDQSRAAQTEAAGPEDARRTPHPLSSSSAVDDVVTPPGSSPETATDQTTGGGPPSPRGLQPPHMPAPALQLAGEETSIASKKDVDVGHAANCMHPPAASRPAMNGCGHGGGNEDGSGARPRDARRQLTEYSENLARQMERREVPPRGAGEPAAMPGPTRVSPIQEEDASPPQPRPGSETATASTGSGSGNTVRGLPAPGMAARTPSYPFPRMAAAGHTPFTTLSFTAPSDPARAPLSAFGGCDTVVSSSTTPASSMPFLPPDCSRPAADPPDFPSPNLYDLVLMLSAEPGLDAWWQTVVQIMVDVYKAERVTLAVPADPTDIENVPWGQKATYNAHHQDDLSLGYLARGSSLIPSSTGDVSDGPPQTAEPPRQQAPARPTLQSRHSFTSYEENRRADATNEQAQPISHRPGLHSRSKSSHPSSSPNFAAAAADDEEDSTPTILNQQTLEQHNALEEQDEIPSWEAPFTAPREGHGKVLDVLQALDYEADPLIDHNGIQRVLDRGRVVALTRTYPYLHQRSNNSKPSLTRTGSLNRALEGAKKRPKKPRSDSLSKLSSLLGNASLTSPASSRTLKAQAPDKKSSVASRIEAEPPKPPSPKYEEYEQAPPSPWSQSPAPSPAVRADPNENPFFTDAIVDEESFNPSGTPADYSSMLPPEAIGVDNSWTVLHIPLAHVLLSKPNPPPSFRLDSSLMEQKISARGKAGDSSVAASPSPERVGKQKHAPIAILSILSPIIPYPSNLRHSLEYLAPHLATTFSLCRHYTNLETELNELQKRRPATAGFGALDPNGRPLADPSALLSSVYASAEDAPSRDSFAGSLTSPSDYSGLSRSAAGSPGGTPGWDPSAIGFVLDKRTHAPSPAAAGGDSCFDSVPKSVPGQGGQGIVRRSSRDASAPEKKSPLRSSGGKAPPHDPAEPRGSTESSGLDSEEPLPTNGEQRQPAERENRDSATAERAGAAAAPNVGSEGQKPRRHTRLHSYGADFASTFPNLPPSSTIGRVPKPPPPSRSGSMTQSDMTPPSDRLKGLILDSLPAHVFVALPKTGEIVWVNSRFLTYRGQTSSELAVDPWGSIHPDDREEYLRAWSHCVRTGEQFSRTVRIRRFDGAYRWFYARAVASKDKKGVILQFLGSYMDIHDQHIAELRAARQEEIEASEAKHRLLANLIPQIIFTATEDEGITFANEQWLSYTGQSFDDVLGLGFMDYVHPDDLAKCRIPVERSSSPESKDDSNDHRRGLSTDLSGARQGEKNPGVPDGGVKSPDQRHSRNNSIGGRSNCNGYTHGLPTANLTELAKQGVVRVSTDSSGRPSYTTEIRLRSKSGEYRWHLVRCVEIDNVDFGNGASSYFGSATDINDLKLLETKLKEAMDSKSRFLSNMSHEIRTPLIGISGMVSFLQDTTLNEEQRDYTNTIQTSANSLLMIINDILDLSKVDAGMMKLSYEWFHTRSLIEDVNELVSTMAIAKRLELNYVVEEDVPAWVKGDKVRIRQVLLNVIGNAIKFTSQGEVFSRCKVVVPEDVELRPDQIMLEFSIVDTGRGFTKEEAELIFKPFSQIDGSSTRQHGGSGLGLVISRQLVELHGGKMEGTAVPGKGSNFTFSAKFGLPTEHDHPDGAPVPQQTPGLARETLVSSSTQPSSASALSAATSASPSTTDQEIRSPTGGSSGSSELSASSGNTRLTGRASISSVNAGLVRISQAARVSGQDLSRMNLEMPASKGAAAPVSAPNSGGENMTDALPPPMFSILIICPQMHSREATTKHIEMTLPKSIPHQITAVASVQEAQALIGGEDSVRFTHIVVNLPSAEEIISLMDKIMGSESNTLDRGKMTILILSDSVQRQAVSKLVAGTKYEEILSDQRVTYVYKPVKPSRFAVIFDPARERDLSIDHNRSTAQRLVEDQRQSYVDMEKRLGGKGYKVLLVEDNPVNQKVLQKYLKRVGVAVELAADGVECTEMVFAKGWGYYSLILVRFFFPSVSLLFHHA